MKSFSHGTRSLLYMEENLLDLNAFPAGHVETMCINSYWCGTFTWKIEVGGGASVPIYHGAQMLNVSLQFVFSSFPPSYHVKCIKWRLLKRHGGTRWQRQNREKLALVGFYYATNDKEPLQGCFSSTLVWARLILDGGPFCEPCVGNEMNQTSLVLAVSFSYLSFPI